MIVRNEAAKLPRCLESASPYVDEIIIADTGSTDGTQSIAKNYGAAVFDCRWNDHFAEARNYALSQSSSKWNLVLDADEYMTHFNREAIRQFMAQSKGLGRIELISETVDDGEFNESRDFITRLLPAGVMFKGRIHEQADSDLLRVKVPITVRHDGYLNTDKSQRNIPLLLKELEEDQNNTYNYYQLGKQYKGINLLNEACHYLRLSYENLTGQERYAPNAVVQYLYALIAAREFEKAISIIEKNHSFVQGFPDYHFACGIFYLDFILSNPERYIHLLSRIELSYKTCIAIGETDRYDCVSGTGSYAALYNLGVYYEMTEHARQAESCYEAAAELGYDKAKNRLSTMRYAK
ncbi:hypothetical protein VN24_07905 [Paenibacillus beijingensis]|uniref:Glycosyltransferase 2-like domain-containing protein n=2 Tax=Paenibacillus beijingensis TaxID=1126833 RepID=A0A0D5NRH0_9BACL|nr:hypothetical protein VN24_07905 [Paenibacillus beijingensis]